ncbi:MAG TPA: hypothetical protein VM368_06900 [Flavisolibacter sp.]|nr:hypothetical protein [Flavisolibacter sp.]
MVKRKDIPDKIIDPVLLGTIAITIGVLTIRLLTDFLPVLKLSVFLAFQLGTTAEIGFSLLCFISILYTYIFRSHFIHNIQMNNHLLAGAVFGFITCMFSFKALLFISVITQSIVAESQLMPLLLSVILMHLIGGILLAFLCKHILIQEKISPMHEPPPASFST